MTHVVPPRFLFRWAFRVPYCGELPGGKTDCLPLPDHCRLPSLEGFDGAQPFADLYLAWNERGLGIGLEVRGKRKSPSNFDPKSPLDSDGLQFWLDTRATQNVHRATRYCHHFAVAPAGDGPQRKSPWLKQFPLAQAREVTGNQGTGTPQMTAVLRPDGYRMDLWMPAESLFGYDPANHTRLGFYTLVIDQELGLQPLTVDDAFPYEFDPSIWQTLELVR